MHFDNARLLKQCVYGATCHDTESDNVILRSPSYLCLSQKTSDYHRRFHIKYVIILSRCTLQLGFLTCRRSSGTVSMLCCHVVCAPGYQNHTRNHGIPSYWSISLSDVTNVVLQKACYI
ncbi:hypothetical protein DPEC_G00011210 [Dallia pectoralis]|uniref:Uncharacterized protein n=1 Tax=Dallia pectoralis TaxID=75939 RepID=A0ACC2HLG3_DALPE|nr:hypothetical protein DPEC_G00011210 [Dallia pectoralis]